MEEQEHSIDAEIPVDELLELKPGWQQTDTLLSMMRDFKVQKERNAMGARLREMIEAADRPAQLEEQGKWVKRIWQQIGADEVFETYSKGHAEIVQEASSYAFPILERALRGLQPTHPVLQTLDKIERMKRQKLLDNIFLSALILGIFQESGNIHIHDICAQDGMTGIAIASLRSLAEGTGITSTLGSEIDQSEAEKFLAVNHIFGARFSRFAYGDSGGLMFKNHPERKTYWIANQSPILPILLEDVAGMNSADLPEGIGLVTCYCHCFQPEANPFESGILGPSDRNKLIEIITAANFDPHPESSVLATKAMQLTDCARAKEINRRNPHVRAHVHEMPGSWTSGIFALRAN